MKFLEMDLEDIIFEAGETKLMERGLYLNGTKKRQLRIGNYGIADLVYYERNHNPIGYQNNNRMVFTSKITVVELKKDFINIEAFLQGIRYVKGIKRYLEDNRRLPLSTSNIKYELALIGKDINLRDPFVYLPDVLPNNEDFELSLYTYDYGVDGITFELRSGYKLTDEGF